jgi:hypothetical protein
MTRKLEFNIGDRDRYDEDAIILNRPAGIPDLLWDAVVDQFSDVTRHWYGPLSLKYPGIQWSFEAGSAIDPPSEYTHPIEYVIHLAGIHSVDIRPETVRRFLIDADEHWHKAAMRRSGMTSRKRIWEMTQGEYEKPFSSSRPINLTKLGVYSLPTERSFDEIIGKWPGVNIISDGPAVVGEGFIGTVDDEMRLCHYITPLGLERFAYYIAFSGGDTFSVEYVVSGRPLNPHAVADLIEMFNRAERYAYPVNRVPLHHEALLLAIEYVGGM